MFCDGKNDMKENQYNNKPLRANSDERAKIGKGIIYFAITVIAILGVTAMLVTGLAPQDEFSLRANLVKDILTALLPVLGTWVGTVLAFYFSKENFIAAAEQTSNLVRQLTPEQKLQATPVADAMISMADPNTAKMIIDKPEGQINLKTELLALFNSSGRNRLPLTDADGKVKYMIHRSLIDKFIAERVLSGNTEPEKLTLQELFEDDRYKLISTAFGTVNRDAKLNAVKVSMDGNPDCSDVFVTEDGTKSSKALGWITNIILAEKSKV
jgi:hypothetical protein